MSTHRWQVTKMEAGIKLLAFLRLHAPVGVSVRALKRAIDTKQCCVNGKTVTVSTTALSEKDHVALEVDCGGKKELSVIHEDDDLLVVNKPPQLVCEDSVINRQFPQYGGRLELIHRLDKETSGVLLIAKNRAFRDKMVALFRDKGVQKVYYAIVDGVVEGESGECVSRLDKLKGHRQQAVYGSVKGRGGKEAITYWTCLKTGVKSSFMEVQPITGRTHQLRVHMSEMGHTILGDLLYRGKKFICYYQPHRNLLHAHAISFVHPTTKEEVLFEVSLPNDFNQALKKLFS